MAADGFSVEDVSLTFGGITALDSLSFDVPEGTVCGLIGPNGAGKTTLFNCASGIYAPSAGRVTFNGTDLLALKAHQLSSHGVARTFQNVGLFTSMTFLENVMVGAHPRGNVGYLRAISRIGARSGERRMRSEGLEILDYFGLADLANAPAAGRPFGTLKRLDLARALAARPNLLLLDEPAGGLNHEEVDELASTMRSMKNDFDLTLLLVEHHMGLVMSVSDKVVAMNLGHKLAEGSPQEVQQHPDVVRAYLGTAAA